MHQWVFVLAVLAASLLHDTQAAQQSDGQLYAASKQGRAQLGAGSKHELVNGPVDVKQPLVLQGVADRPAIISCSRNGSHAFVVR